MIALAAPNTDDRGATLLREDLDRTRRATDAMMVWLLLAQWVGAIITALVISPRAWAGSQSEVHLHVWAAVFLGGLLALFPAWLARTNPGATLTRHSIAAAQMVFSALLIHLGGGRIEWHFHVFGSLAFLAVYRDWRVLLTATLVVAIDHFARGVWWPRSVFGVLTTTSWRWLEHAAWVLFEDSVLVVSILRGMRDARAIADGRARLESAMAEVEQRVEERTRELREATLAAQVASRAKSDFLANMSHEIRTPMTAIVGFADLLDDPETSEQDRGDHIRTIRRNGQHLIGIVNDVLDLSKVESGRLEVLPSACSIAEIVGEVVALKRPLAQGKGLALNAEIGPSVPARIGTDPLRLRQILVNLVGNAVKFTNRGRVDVRASYEAGSTGAEAGVAPAIRIDVVDTGIGIAPDDVPRLFSTFWQADSSGTREYGGTGLGLSISRHLAEALGGRIDVESRPGAGSTFTLRIAAMAVGDSGEAAAPACAGADGAGRSVGRDADPPTDRRTATDTDGPRVLLVEDGEDNQRLIAFLLRKGGARVEVAENGQVGVEAALRARERAEAFDLIFMDMQMPVLDGYAATRRLRERGYAGRIVALTAHAMDGDRERCLAAGCDDYETKPVSRERLAAHVAFAAEGGMKAAA
ncbi:MAG: ATP-binding protein [Phycisphaerales bacterium]